MAKYQQYEQYKESGVEWLGDIPSYWEINRHKYVASFTKGKNPQEIFDEYSPDYYPYLSMDSLRGNSAHKYAPLAKNLYLVNENQPLIIWDGSNAGEFVRGRRGILSSTMAAAKLNCMMNPNYYWYLCMCIEPEMRKHANGMGIPHVNGDELKNISLVNPSLSEQSKIANFLDFETAQIDTLIEKQQTLIQLLKEKRQAVISHAVTKGLNPDAPMKDSGVEWLGEVPEHWKVMPLKYAVTFQRGHDLPAQNRTAGDIPLVTSAGISSTHNIAIAKAPGLVTGRYGTIGKFNLLEEDYWPLNTTLYSINLRGNNPKYLWYMLHNLTPIFLANSLKSAVPGVDRNDLHVVKVAMPKNLDEQEALCDYLEKTHCKYDLVIEKASESLVLLQERRTALISAAITGKIDVRGWVKPNFH